MHNKRSDSVEREHGNQAMRKSKSTSNLAYPKKKINQMKVDVHCDQVRREIFVFDQFECILFRLLFLDQSIIIKWRKTPWNYVSKCHALTGVFSLSL